MRMLLYIIIKVKYCYLYLYYNVLISVSLFSVIFVISCNLIYFLNLQFKKFEDKVLHILWAIYKTR